MNVQEQFNIQWHDIRDVVLSEAQRQINVYNKVMVEQLTEKLINETSKWKKGVLAYGIFYKSLMERDNSKALAFSQDALALKIIEPKHNYLPSYWWLSILWLALATFLIIVLHTATSLNFVEQIFYPILTFILLNTASYPFKKKKHDQAVNDILNDLKNQMEAMRKKLERHL